MNHELVHDNLQPVNTINQSTRKFFPTQGWKKTMSLLSTPERCHGNFFTTHLFFLFCKTPEVKRRPSCSRVFSHVPGRRHEITLAVYLQNRSQLGLKKKK